MERGKKDTREGYITNQKISHQRKRLKDLHRPIPIVFKAFLVHKLEIIPK